MRRAGAIVIGVLAVAGLLLGAPVSDQASAADNAAKTSVIKGTTAPIAEFPWLVFIAYEGPVDRFACTGTVVAPRVVLTAGHCAVSESGRALRADRYRVAWGTANVDKADPAKLADVAQVLVYPGYNPNNFRHDAALLVLSAPVAAAPLPLATAADRALYADGTPIAIAGWGLTDGDTDSAPAAFRTGTTEIGSTAFCQWKSAVPFDPASQLCASDQRRREQGACYGDSGGPGVARRADGSQVQVGIISMGGPFCDVSYPEIQTRVDRISTWAASWIAAVEAGAAPPRIAPPRLYRLPRLTFPAARFFASLLLADDFRRSFADGRRPKLDCRRIDRMKVTCGVLWRRSRTVYGGGLTVSYALPREGSLVRFSYRIRKVHAGCWERRGGFKRCPGPVFTDDEQT